MSTPFLGQIQAFPYNFAPKGWAMCNGQQLAISQYQALFSLLGTTYGGNGVQTFALPNLQGRCAISFGNSYVQGAAAGEPTHTLTSSETPTHTHNLLANAATANLSVAVNNYPAAIATGNYVAATPDTPVNLLGGSNQNSGGQPHANMQPYLTLNYCISLSGIFPSRN